MSRPLEGFRVVESSMLLNGVTTTMHLADLGAEVIKVESPFLGDYLRVDETLFMHDQVNKNKRSVALDLRTDDGRGVLRRLIESADVFVTNATSESNERLGLSYEALRSYKPDLVYCQNTGFGATGPYATLPTHGQMMDAIAGALPAEMGDDGLVRQRTVRRRTGTLQMAGEGTTMGAIFAAFHVAAALAHRERTGEGCFIDISSAEAVLASAWIAASGRINRVPGRDVEVVSDEELARRTEGVARYQMYRTKDERFVLFCPEEKKFWQRFCDEVGRPDLLPQRFGVELRREIQAIISTRTLEEWMAFAVRHRLPIGPANDGIDDVRNDPQIAHRGMLFEDEGHDGKPFVFIGSPGLVDGERRTAASPAPSLGEQTNEVLAELGYSATEIADLAARHITTSPEFRSDHIDDVHAEQQRRAYRE